MLKVLTKGCEPTLGSKYSVCVDLMASETKVIQAGTTEIIGLGVCIDLDFNAMFANYNCMNLESKKDIRENFMKTHYLELNPRSSLRAKGLISNTGKIDIDYIPSCSLGKKLPNSLCDVFEKIESLRTEEIKCTNCKHFKQNEIKIIIHNPYKIGNDDNQSFTIQKCQRIAQVSLMQHQTYLMGIKTEDERIGGLGSTDKEES